MKYLVKGNSYWLFLEIRDRGIPFDPCRIKKPRLKDLVSEEQKGGPGIFLPPAPDGRLCLPAGRR
jgi:hypothetical protein